MPLHTPAVNAWHNAKAQKKGKPYANANTSDRQRAKNTGKP